MIPLSQWLMLQSQPVRQHVPTDAIVLSLKVTATKGSLDNIWSSLHGRKYMSGIENMLRKSELPRVISPKARTCYGFDKWSCLSGFLLNIYDFCLYMCAALYLGQRIFLLQWVIAETENQDCSKFWEWVVVSPQPYMGFLCQPVI